MKHSSTNLATQFKRGNIVTQLIYINVGIFVIIKLFEIVLRLFNFDASEMFNFLALPTSLTQFAHQPWSLFTYMFMHAGIIHILFNMLWLYWFGTIFLELFSARHLLGIYLFGGICGGLLYILSYNVFPFFSPYVEYSNMVGASASILAIVIATAYKEPNYKIPIFLIGQFKLKYLALATVAVDLLLTTSNNAGGHISHLGGALAGFWFAASLNRGIDITAWLNKIIDFFVNLFNKKTWKRKPKMKVHYGYSERQQDYEYNKKKKEQSDEIDQILDKLKKSGYQSLSTKEKKALFDAGKK